jgi:two-component system response regulator
MCANRREQKRSNVARPPSGGSGAGEGSDSAMNIKEIDPSTGPIVILLVDDDPDCRMLIRDAIEECKVSNQIREAANGEEALTYLRQCEQVGKPMPGLIYLDVEMPGLNGLETLEKIRHDPALSDIPVVMMTGVCGQTQMNLAAKLGANSYTLKPANAEQFLRTVLESTNYWLTIHQSPTRHLAPELCRHS